jgi:hypothetical protein
MKVYGVDNEAVADVNASRLLSNAKIQKYIIYCRDHVEEVANISKAMIIEELKKIAFSSIAHLHDTWITLKEFEKLTDDQKASIQSIETQTRKEVKEGEVISVDYVKIKLYSKQAALETLNKMQGYNQPDKVDLTNSDNSLSQLSTEELLKRATAVNEIKK